MVRFEHLGSGGPAASTPLLIPAAPVLCYHRGLLVYQSSDMAKAAKAAKSTKTEVVTR